MVARGLLGELGFEEIPRRTRRGPGASARRIAANSSRGPASRRASISVVATLDVGERSRAGSRRCVRTLWPTSRPMSQRKARKRSSARRPRRSRALRQQDHDVDVGTGMQLAAAVAADRDQRRRSRRPAPRAGARRASRSASTSARAIAHQRLDGSSAPEALARAPRSPSASAARNAATGSAPAVERAVERLRGNASCRRGTPARARAVDCRGRDRRDCSGRGAVGRAERQHFEARRRVTSTVCSHCADSE